MLGLLGQFRQHLAQFDSGCTCRDRPELATNLCRGFGFGVPEIDVAGGALKVDQHDRVGVAESAATTRLVGPKGLPVPEQFGQAEADQ